MIYLKKRRQRSMQLRSGERIKFGPEFTLWVDPLKKGFPVFSGIAGKESYFCEDEMTLKEARSLVTAHIPNGLSIMFPISKNKKIFHLCSIEKKNDRLLLVYSLFPDVYTHKSFKWSLQTYFDALKKESYGFKDIMIKRYNWGSHDDMWIEFKFIIPLLNSVAACCKYAETRLAQMHATVQMALGDIYWTRNHEKK